MASISEIKGQADAVASAETGARLRHAALFGVVITLFMTAFGGQWDVNWHMYVGRDWFWIPPHVLIYSGVAGAGLIALMVTAWSSLYASSKTRGYLGLPRLHAPAGFALVGLGALVMIASAPFDDWWHQVYGIDVTIWSPPHLGGVVGSGVILLGALVESATGPAGILNRAGRPSRLAQFAFPLACAGLLRVGLFGNIPASQYSFWGDDYSFQFFGWHNPYLFPVLLSLFGAYVAVAAAQASRRAWMPLVVLAFGFVINRLAQWVADIGTDTLVRLTGYHYRFGRYELGFSAEQMFLWPLLAMAPPFVVAAIALDPARRVPAARAGAAAGFAFGLTLFVEFAIYMSLAQPPLTPDLASPGLTLLSLGLCLGLGALSGFLGARLVGAMERGAADWLLGTGD